MSNIIILGNFGATNIGDEAILESTMSLIREKDKKSKINVVSFDPTDTISRYKKYKITATNQIPLGVRSIFTKTPNFVKSIETLKKADYVIFGGGGLLTDSSSILAIMLWFAHFFFFKDILKKPVIVFAQSIGPVNSFLGKKLVKYILDNSEKITVRDNISKELLHYNFDKKNVKVIPDPVFLIPSTKPILKKKNNALEIAISIRPWKSNEVELINSLLKVLSNLNKKKDIKVHLIPMQYIRENDVDVLTYFKEKLVSKKISVKYHTPKDYNDVLEILKFCDIAIGMRLHFLILSIKSNLPFLAISYSSKVQSIFDDLGFSDYMIDITDSSKRNLIEEKVNKILAERKDIISRIEKINEKMKIVRKTYLKNII